MADKNYENEIIVESPFPGEVVQPISSSPSNVGDNHSPTTTSVKPFPTKRTAVELLSTSLNTKSRKILQEFELQQSGGLKIGDFEQGLTGDLRLTPNGITARDIAGLTTFAIDGTTGDAVFKGQIRGGSIISDTTLEGNSIAGGSININNNFIVDSEGNVTIGVASNVATGISPSLFMYNDEGTLVGKMEGDVAIARYIRWDSAAFGDTIFYEGAVTLTNEIMRVNVDDGLKMFTNKNIRLRGTGSTGTALADNELKLYVDQSAGKDRLMCLFNTGVAQVVATEP